MLADVQAVAFDFRGDPQTGDDLGDERRDHGSNRCPNDGDDHGNDLRRYLKIGRASCRERV